ncbi:accessory gene regulator B family protein [Paenibacillus sp. SC116]|uniref:accessory gene regulator ArgB-like protein n=1 Tax=Paenibacillus sp. SC116 TaxID=2968986 RepID=UPI00215ACB1D|nr:accessory gene regulator B family protein [Paenibacillus sp. SC116]MCR8842831.1 accessory gene regulator B family protein [Paenibacillus sp. SC116]
MKLEYLSRRIATEIKRSDPDGDVSIEVMEYALGVRLNLIATILMTILFGVVTGYVLQSLLALLAFGTARRYSGGYHMASLTGCAIVSALLFSAIPLIDLESKQLIFISVITIIIFAIFSPNDFEDLNESKIDPYLKPLSVVIVSTNLLIQSPVVGLAFFAQAVLLIPWKGGKK